MEPRIVCGAKNCLLVVKNCLTDQELSVGERDKELSVGPRIVSWAKIVCWSKNCLLIVENCVTDQELSLGPRIV